MGTQKTVSRRLILFFVGIVLALGPGNAPVLAAEVYSPKRGNAERKAILNAVRVPVEKGMKQKVIFIVDTIKVLGAWAFVQARPRSPKGRMLSFKGTRWEKNHKEGFVDDGLAALLRRDTQGWVVIKWVMGPTDVAWEPWPKLFGAPAVIFR